MNWTHEDRVWIAGVLEECSFGDWEFVVGGDTDRGGLFLQVGFGDGEPSTMRGQKWPLSPLMSKTQIVQLAFRACVHSLEQEARYDFRYRDRPIFAPVFDVDRLARMVDDPAAVDPGRVRK